MEEKKTIDLEELKAFAFDVLGDFMPERAYMIEELLRNRVAVIIRYSGLVEAPMSIVREEWERQTAGTKFENVELFAPV